MPRRQARQVGFDGAALRAARLAIDPHLTQEQLARQIDVTLRTVQRWEDGLGQPNGSKLLALSEVLGVEPDDLYGEPVAA